MTTDITGIFISAYSSLSINMDGKLIKPDNLILYVKYAMELAELTQLKGAEQKHLVIGLITKLVNESDLSPEYKSPCIDFIESGALSQTIDIIVDATKGRLAINKPASLLRRVLLCWATCIRAHRA
jgi:hypothetical protein